MRNNGAIQLGLAALKKDLLSTRVEEKTCLAKPVEFVDFLAEWHVCHVVKRVLGVRLGFIGGLYEGLAVSAEAVVSLSDGVAAKFRSHTAQQ